MKKLLEVSEAEKKLAPIPIAFKTKTLDLARVLRSEAHFLLNKVTAKAIKTDRDYPPYDRICLDGIAIRYDEKTLRREWQVRGMIKAGDEPVRLESQLLAWEVNTGGVLPILADTVIPYEHLTFVKKKIAGKTLTLAFLKDNHGYQKNQNIHPKGSDLKKNEIALPKNTRLLRQHISLLTSLGVKEIKILQPPQITVIQTGSELVPFTSKAFPHQIRISNLWQMKMQLESEGFPVAASEIVPDDFKATTKALKNALAQFDLIIVIGGISKGKFDFVKKSLTQLKVKEIFHGVAQRPGKPFYLGCFTRRGKKIPIFSLPGNPQSALVCLKRYVISFLFKKLKAYRKPLKIELASDVTFNKPLTLFQLVHLNEQGQAVAVKHQGSGDFNALAKSDGFIELPQNKNQFFKGEKLDYYSWH